MQHDTIICGRAEEVLAGFPDACIDLTVTSPPYDGLRAYKGYAFDFEAIARQLYRVTKPGGVAVWVVGDETKDGSESGTSFRQALGFMEIGFKLHDTMIYRRAAPPLTHRRYEQEFEYMFVLSRGTLKTFNPILVGKSYRDKRVKKAFRREADGHFDMGFSAQSDDRIQGNVWDYNAGGGQAATDRVAYDHPAIFPERLAEDHILSWSDPGDLVLDPMCGSGTTCKMAIRHHRRFVGIDISEEYCALARRRISGVQPVLFDLVEGRLGG